MSNKLEVIKEKHPIVSFKDVVGDIPESNAMQIKRSYFPMVKMLKSFEEEYEKVSIMEITSDSCKLAGDLRKKIKKVRTSAERNRVEQKAKYLRAGKAVDMVYNTLADAVVLREEKLQEMEKYYENLEKKIIKDNRDERLIKLRTLDPNFPELVGLGERDDEEFEMIFDGHEKKYIESSVEVVRVHVEAVEAKRLSDIKESRILECSRYADYIPGFDMIDWLKVSDEDYDLLFSDAVSAKTAKDEEIQQQEEEAAAAEKLLTDKADLFVEKLLKDGCSKRPRGDYIKNGLTVSYDELKIKSKREFNDFIKNNNLLIQTETNNFILKCWNEADEINLLFDLEAEANEENKVKDEEKARIEKEEAEAKAAALAPDKDKLIKMANDFKEFLASQNIKLERGKAEDIKTSFIGHVEEHINDLIKLSNEL